jgi:hypothetical protein
MYMSRAYLFICVSDGRHMPCVRHVTSGPSSCTDEFVVLVDGPLLSAFPVQRSFSKILDCPRDRGRDCFQYCIFSQASCCEGRCAMVCQARPGLTRLIFATQFPRASIMTPSKLTPDTQADLFAVLQSSADDVRHVFERAGGGLQVRSTALLSLPSDMTARLTDSLPNISVILAGAWSLRLASVPRPNLRTAVYSSPVRLAFSTIRGCTTAN